MQKSETYQENKNFISSSNLMRVCPRCGEHTRRSSAKTTDGVIKIFFYTFYRCQVCRFFTIDLVYGFCCFVDSNFWCYLDGF